MKVSVVVPVYNSEHTLEKCLGSLIDQSYSDLEIILINDGSLDNSEALCLKYAEKDKRIVYKSQKNRGASSARNLGIDTATGEYICFVDSDDYVEPDYISTMVGLVGDDIGHITICDYDYGKNEKRMQRPKEMVYSSKEAVIEMFLGKIFDSCVCCKLVPTTTAKEIKFNEDIVICEDMFFYYQVLTRANCIKYISKSEYHYIQNENSTINTISEQKIKSLSIFETMMDKENDSDIVAAIVSKYISTCFHFLGIVYGSKDRRNREISSCLKDIIKRYRMNAIISHNTSLKVRVACVISLFSFDLIMLILKR